MLLSLFSSRLDPLIAVSNVLASRALCRGLLWSLLIVLATFFLGRFFRQPEIGIEARQAAHRIQPLQPRQTAKYYILIVVLVAALFGTGLVGWFEVLAGLAAGVAVLPRICAATSFAAERNDRRIRPPGARDESDFMVRCIRCGECMKVCPGNALHPSFSEAGVEALWTPVLVARIGYCEPSCTLCSQACPTGAIGEITPKSKAWAVGVSDESKPIGMGTAFL